MAAASSFAQRFEFARARQHALGTWQEDAALAAHLSVAASQITEYKARDEAPPAKRTLAIAKWCGVDPGWLAFGAESLAPAPAGFDLWMENRAKATEAAAPQKKPQLATESGAPLSAFITEPRLPGESKKKDKRRRA